MNPRYQKLKTLLKELFQLDQPDLDFGLYRVMHAKSAEVSQFLDEDLLPQVKDAFSLYRSADKAEIEEELNRAIAHLQGLGANPDESTKVKELRDRLESDAVDIDVLESEVYDHLYTFFRRYYSEGDFLAKRVYKPGVYAIPYEGEEVTLHWANKDQYYVKTSEYLRDYTFRLRPHDSKKPLRVHFRLMDATAGEHDNIKPSEGKDRVFVLMQPGESGRDFIAEEADKSSDELVIRFEYRPPTLGDWPDDVRGGKTKPPAQKDLLGACFRAHPIRHRRPSYRGGSLNSAHLTSWPAASAPTTAGWTRTSDAIQHAIPSTTSSTRISGHSSGGSWISTSRTKSCTSTT